MRTPLPKRGQQGLALLDILLYIALLGLILVGVAQFTAAQKHQHEARDYRVRIEAVITALQKHQYQESQRFPPVDPSVEFPAHLNDLMTPEEQFWINCTDADEASRRCVQPDYVPWTTQHIDYVAGSKSVNVAGELRDIAYAQLTFPLSSGAISPTQRTKWSVELLKMPYAREEANGDVHVTVYDPLLSQLYDAFLQHDGSVALSEDWDVGGNHALLNAQDYTLTNSDGTQKIVSKGLTDIYTVQHNDTVQKPSCPANQTPVPHFSLGQIEINNSYELTGSQKAYIKSESSTHWTFGLEVRVLNLNTGQPEKLHDGFMTVFVQCD